MPRAPKYTVEVIFDRVKELVFFNDTGKLKPLSERVWEEAIAKINHEMSIKHMYLYISRNDHNIQDMLRKRHCVEQSPETSLSENNYSHDSNWSMDVSHGSLSSLRVTITISSDDWNRIRPRDVCYADRDYKVLRLGWTDILQEQLWREHKLPCCYAFKNPKVNEIPGEPFLWIKGKCTECGIGITLYSSIKPTDDGLTLQVSTSDTKDIVHHKKRQLRGEKRKRVAKEVTAQSTYAWRRQKANEFMIFGDKVPAHLYDEDVLRKSKQTESDRILGIRKGVGVLESVRELKYRPEFVGTIREIGYDKFFVMYWSPEQIFLYKKHWKDSSKIGSLSLDATGTVVSKIPKPDGSSSTIYLYQGVIPFCNKIMPVFQMVSEKHDANLLTYWLREWLRSGVPYPTEIVTDYSLAFLNATSLAFETADLNSYVNRCFTLVNCSSTVSKPRCCIRIDIAHLIKLVTRWKCFLNTHRRVKEFFLRCIGLMAKCTTFERFEVLLRDTLTVAFSETEDMSSDDCCFVAQKQLIENIKSMNENDIDIIIKEEVNIKDPDNSEGDSKVELDLEGSEFDVTGNFSAFLLNVEDDCKQKARNTGDRPNPYWCPKFASNLLRISKHFTLWTSIFASNGRPATSSRSEEYFRELKHQTLNSDRNFRVDKFLVKHIRSISGTEKLLNADRETTTDHSRVSIGVNKIKKVKDKLESELDQISKLNQEPEIDETVKLFQESGLDENLNLNKNITTSFEETHAYLHEEENWGGKNLSQSKSNNVVDKKPPICARDRLDTDVDLPKAKIARSTKRGKYLTPCPDIESVLDKPNCNINLPLLKNGQVLGPVRIARKDVTFYNTCSFDSLAQSVLTGFRDWACYNDYIKNTDNEFYDFIRTFSASGTTTQTYRKRSILLSTKFAMKSNSIDCHCNIANLVSQHLLTSESSYKISQACHDCGRNVNDNRPVIEVSVKIFYERGIQALESAVNEKISDRIYQKCIRCGSGNVRTEITTGLHLFIDIECLQWTELAANMRYPNWPGVFTISEIPLRLSINGFNYILVSVMEYIGTADPKSIGHYVAYVHRITGRWEVHNDLCIDSKPILATARALLHKRKLAMLMYVKQM